MRKGILAVSLSLMCAVLVQAQRTDTSASGQGSSRNSASISEGAKSVNIESGTSIAAQLQNTIDVRKARVGDQIVLKTTRAIKSEGRTVVAKGARLVGHVTEVAQKGEGSASSRVGIVFDRLENGSLTIPIGATIRSITGTRTSAAVDDEMFGTSASGTGRASTSTSASSNGGLLGVGSVVNSTTSTVGSTVGATTSAVASTVDSTTRTVGNTTTTLGGSLGRIRISESSSTSVEGGSVLSLQGDNLKLEKGTNFNLVLSHSASAGSARDQ